MSTFAITANDNNALVDAVNHLLATQGQGGNSGNGSASGNYLTVNSGTGQITSGGIIVSYLYRWIQVRYADSADGGTGFSATPTNKAYYGLYNSQAQVPGDIDNPTNYQWTQATGGFGTTKFVWYATYGGGQVAWFVGTAAPNSSYAQVPLPPPTNAGQVDLNFVTATSTLPLVTPIIYQRGNTAPATPTGGSYDFTTLTLTPPSGWATSIPTGNLPCYTSQNQFQAVPAGGPVGPSLAWTTPVITSTYGTNGANGANGANGISTVNYSVFKSSNSSPGTPTGGYYNFATATGTPPAGGWSNTPVSVGGDPIWASTASLSTNNPTANISIGTAWTPTFQYTGAGGAQGERGPIPMAYVLTPSNPIGASTVQLSAWFGASRDNVVAPIGMGTPPISNDTACFTDATNSANNVVYTFDALTNVWTAVKGSVVNGNVFVTGSVNAAAMNANDVYALTMKGGLVTAGVNSGKGFWLTATPVGSAAAGDAYMSGNVYLGNTTTIGANLIVGNNAYIGGNLTVAGLITGNGSGATLNSNTVNTGQMVNNSVSLYYVNSIFTVKTIPSPTNGTAYATDLILNNVPLVAGSTLIYNYTMSVETNFPSGPGTALWYYFNNSTMEYRANGTSTWNFFASVGDQSYNIDQYYGSWGSKLNFPPAAYGPVVTTGNYDFRVTYTYYSPVLVAGTGTLPVTSNVQIGGQTLLIQQYKK